MTHVTPEAVTYVFAVQAPKQGKLARNRPFQTSRLQIETSSVEKNISTVEVSTCRRVIFARKPPFSGIRRRHRFIAPEGRKMKAQGWRPG
jgi:hypothetical protein